MIRIVTDSTCDLPEDLIRQYAIQVVPVHIRFGTEMYKDRVTIDADSFYRRVGELRQLPHTSQPSPTDFVEAYQALATAAEPAGAPDDSILSIHLTSKLSGTYQSAVMAAASVTNQIKVNVFDSLAGSGGLGFMCLEAARMAEAGKPPEEILNRLQVIRSQMTIFFVVANLEFARMSGRVGRLQSVLASMLDIKPLIGLDAGALDVVERVRSRTRALDRLVELVRGRVGQSRLNLAVIHARAPEDAARLFDRLQHEFNCAEAFWHELALGVAVHLGPGTLGVVAYPAP